MKPLKLAVILVSTFAAGIAPLAYADELRIGMIGLDTSHVVAFTRILNDSDHPGHVPGGKVVAAYKGGSDDIEASYSRVDGFTRTLEEDFDVTIVDSIEELCKKVDAVMLESVDGRPHLKQARPVIKAGLPLFIDKPVAGSLADAIEIYQLSREHDVPIFTSSAYRYYSGLVELQQKEVGRIRSVISYGPAYKEPHHPDLFWYGIHPTEALFTVMGPGCKTVVRTATKNTDVVTGTWQDGRVGTLYGLRNGKTPHHVIIFGTKAVAKQGRDASYAPLVAHVMQFFKTGTPPVDFKESLEIYAFMEAADESKRREGRPVKIEKVMEANGWKGEWP